MRDYIRYFVDKRVTNKRGVEVRKDIDWWMGYFVGRGAKLLFLLLLGATFVVVRGFFQMGQNQSIFPVKQITLSGDVMITQPQDIEKSLISVSSNSFFNLDIEKVASEIKALPWIEDATVTRYWPNKVDIHIQERKAEYRWGKHELLDANGNRFANIEEDAFSHLPQLEGVDGHELEVILAYQELVAEFGDTFDELKVSSFILNKYLSWELHLESGLVVKFGRDEFTSRLKLFASAYKQRVLPDFAQLNSIDLRYKIGFGFAVGWKPEFDPATAEKSMVKVSAKQI